MWLVKFGEVLEFDFLVALVCAAVLLIWSTLDFKCSLVLILLQTLKLSWLIFFKFVYLSRKFGFPTVMFDFWILRFSVTLVFVIMFNTVWWALQDDYATVCVSCLCLCLDGWKLGSNSVKLAVISAVIMGPFYVLFDLCCKITCGQSD